MNQKGESLVMCLLIIVVLTGVVLLSAMELKKNFSLMEKRTHLFLCTKEIKGEVTLYLKFMGRANWAIKNINRVRLITMFIPGLQGVSSNAQKAKKLLQAYQNYKLISYLKTLKDLKRKSCPLDPQMIITPYQLVLNGYKRDAEGAAELRKKEWTYYYFSKPYLLSMKMSLKELESPVPKVHVEVTEKMGILSSPWSLHF